MKIVGFIKIALAGIGIIAVLALLLGLPLMWLWNWLMPVIFTLPEIGFWQAVGLNFLSGILFKHSSSSNTKS